MVFESLKRTNFDHGSGTEAQDHHQDYSQYHDPLARMEHANFFSAGIVQGLNVTGTIGANELLVQPGVAIDHEGRLIALAEGGFGDIGANPLVIPPQSTPAPVPVTLSTTSHEDQTVFVTIQFSEFFSQSPSDPTDPGDYEQRPWVRLQDVSLYDPLQGGLILARVIIDGAGTVTGIHGQDRVVIRSSLNHLRLRKGQAGGPSSGDFNIAEETTIEFDGATADVIVGGAGQAGDLRLRNSNGDTTVNIDGAAGDLLVGGAGQAGNFELRNGGGDPTTTLDGATGNVLLGGSGQAGNLDVRDSSGAPTAQIDGATGNLTLGGAGQNGDLILRSGGGSPMAQINGAGADFLLGGSGQSGDIRVSDSAGREVLNFNGAGADLYVGANGNEGDIVVRDGAGRSVMHFNGTGADLNVGANGNAGDIVLKDGAGRAAMSLYGAGADLYVGANGNEGDIVVRDSAGRNVLHFNGAGADLYVGANGNEGDIYVRDGAGRNVMHFDSHYAALYLGASGNEGDLRVRDNAGADSISLDGNTGTLTARRVNASSLNATSHVRLYRNWFSAYAWNTDQYHYLWINHSNRNDYAIYPWYALQDVRFGTKSGRLEVKVLTEQTSRTRFRLYVKESHALVQLYVLCVRK